MTLQQLKDKQLQETDVKIFRITARIIGTAMQPDCATGKYANDFDKYREEIKELMTSSIELAYEEGKKEKTMQKPARDIAKDQLHNPEQWNTQECKHEWGTSEYKCNFATGYHQHCFKCKVVRKTPQPPQECKTGCLEHKYHCVKCLRPLTYSPQNFASRPQDIPNPCEFCFKPPEKNDWEDNNLLKVAKKASDWNEKQWQLIKKGILPDVLLSHRQDILEEIRGKVRELEKPDLRKTAGHKMTCTSCADDRAYNQALSDFQSKLREMVKG